MASEIRVNRLSNRSGLSTITFANGGVQFSGITTFANGDFRVGTGATILNPSANEMQFHTGGSNRLTINNSGANLGTGNITAVDATFSGNVSIGKTLTYEDVKNVDSVGVVTARTGVKITGGDFTVGTAITASSVTGNVTQDVGITTFSGSAVWFKGATANKDMYWSHSSGATVYKDNAQILMGDSSDLQISHDGSNSYIKDAGTGGLRLCADEFNVKNAANNEVIIRGTQDLGVELYHNNYKKFETNSTGIKVSGTRLDQYASGEVAVLIGSSNAGGAAIYLDGDSDGNFVGGDYSWIRHTTGGDLEFVVDNPAAAGNLIFKTGGSSERLRITADGPHLLLGGTSDVNEITESSSNAGMVIGSTSYGNAGLAIITSNSGAGRLYFGDNIASDAGRNRGAIIYYHSSDHMHFQVAGSEKLRIDSTGRVSAGKHGVGTYNDASEWFKVQSNDSAANISIVASNDSHSSLNLGDEDDFNIQKIRSDHTNNSLQFFTADVERVRIDSSGVIHLKSNTYAQNTTKELRFSPTTSTTRYASIQAVNNSGNNHIDLRFFTAAADTPAERLRIDENGLVMMGTTSPGFGAYGDALTIYKANHVGLTLRTATNKDAAIYFADSASGNGRYPGFIDYSHGSNYLRFGTNENERMRIDSSGDIVATGNLKTNNITGKNLVINGSFQVDQRNNGAELSITSNSLFSADRWTHNNDGHTYYKTQRRNDGPIQTIGTEYYMRATVTTAVTLSGSTSQVIENNLEGNTVRWLNLGTSQAKQCTVSFWVRCSLTGTFGGALVNGAYNRCHPFSYTVSSANTWEYKTFTFTTTGFTTGSFSTDNSVGLRLVFSYGNGTGRQADPANGWSTQVKFGPTGETNLVATNGATMDIASVQLEEGTQATRFDHRSYAEELRLCQRYCFRLGGGDTEVGTTLALAIQSHSTTCKAHIQFPVTMRSKDFTYTISDLTLDDDVVGYGAGRVNSISSDQSSTTSSTLIFNTDSMGTVRATRVVADTVGGYIQAECEL